MKRLMVVAFLAVAGVLATIGYVYLGAFNVAADEPHSRPFLWLVETIRERSIAVRARELRVPPLGQPAMIASGAADYNEMCAGCHLKPGAGDSEIRTAMYPRPPDLTKAKGADPAQTFWVIKHGIKMTGMPAWGATHDDQRMWAIVAFLQQLPRLTPAQYQILSAREEGEEGGHSHGEADGMSMSDEQPDAGHGESGHTYPDMSGNGGARTPAGAVDSFFRALAFGDAKQAQRWLAPDVLVYESGHVESSRKEYMEQHMRGDMEFLAGANTERLERSIGGDADIAWVTSRTRIRDQSRGKPVDVVSTETIVLKREPAGWRIQHIHWSSAAAEP